MNIVNLRVTKKQMEDVARRLRTRVVDIEERAKLAAAYPTGAALLLAVERHGIEEARRRASTAYVVRYAEVGTEEPLSPEEFAELWRLESVIKSTDAEKN